MAQPKRIECDSRESLLAIAKERDEWAVDAEKRDLHGSANEYRLTAELARRLSNTLT